MTQPEPARTAVYPPPPGRAVLACRCGTPLDLTDMHTRDAGRYGNGDPKLGAITCADCADTPDQEKPVMTALDEPTPPPLPRRPYVRPAAAQTPGPMRHRPHVRPDTALTDREREVLQLVARGLTDSEIGKRLYLTTNTVKVHIRSILVRLAAANRTHAVRRGFQLGYLTDDEATS